MDDAAAIARIGDLVLQELARDASIAPAALTLLLRGYTATGRDDLRDALGPALARALDDAATSTESSRQADWLILFAEAAALADDDRLPTSAGALAATLQRGWPSAGSVEAAMQSVDACLIAASVCDRVEDATVPRARDLIAAAVDELERVVGIAYRPGEGVSHTLRGRSGPPGGLGDQVRAASALLSAHAVTGRLPYAMLAEELMQFARQTWFDDEHGGFAEAPGTPHPAPSTQHPAPSTPGPEPWNPDPGTFVTNCEAARVLCRLSALHDDAAYRQIAVVAPRADYAGDAGRTLARLAPASAVYGPDAAIYAVALGEWIVVR